MLRPVAGSGGRSSRVASQPRCCNTPRKGGDATALPTTFTRLGRVEDRRERGVFVEGLTTPAMHVADRSPHLLIGVRPQILHQEVDEPAIALEEGQHLRRPIGGLDRHRWRCRHPGRQWCGRRAKGIKNVVRDPSVKD